MKKFILAAAAATLVATPALAAPQHGQHYQPRHSQKVVVKKAYKPQVNQYRKWRKGERFDARQARNYRQVDYRGYHGRLRAPPRGYRYVQSGNDVVLVSIVGGIIGAVFANLIR
jgi:Ni/Co efflux regulator RcnB